MDINMEESGVKSIVSSMNDSSSQMLDCINELEHEIEVVSETWKGQDALKYVEVMRDRYIPELLKFKNSIDDYATFLSNIPEAYFCLDETYKNKSIDA